MQPYRKDKKVELKRSPFSNMEKMHPYKMLLLLVVVGSAFIFLFLILAFNIFHFQKNHQYFRIPRAFVISTILLLISGFFISNVLNYFKTDDIKRLKLSLVGTLFLGTLFLIVQYWGWTVLNVKGVFFSGSPSDTYLYIIFGLHTFHFIAALTYIAYLSYSLMKVPKDPVYNLLLFTNPFEKMKLEIAVLYWHFIGLSWMGIFLYFLFAF